MSDAALSGDPLARVRRIHDRLVDERSRQVLRARVEFGVTADPAPFLDLVDHGEVDVANGFKWADFFDDIRDHARHREIVIYGAGGEGDALAWLMDREAGVRASAYCDRNTTLRKSLPVLAPAETVDAYLTGRAITFVIGTEMYFDEIHGLLIDAGVAEEHILGGRGAVERQYFDPDIVTLRRHEVFVDGGALDLGTSMVLLDLQRQRGGTAECIGFEPDPKNLERARALIAGGEAAGCELAPFGLWSHRTELSFDSTSNGSSHLVESGGTQVRVTDLDSWLGDREITFIKLDIEGAEREALAGARRVIERDHPTLALSVYHRPDDVLVIPEFVAAVTPEHTWYLRHHSIYPAETVFYALP